ncbi:hypothetical protein PY650_21010 [Rhizobium calliandrae]|uniref:Uncharacterized protein n=1 Tax=Rhizobium calliandrae TaxID=1312182 RepID=A0ABT7KHH1_9HYPH|nr:hypothetical protein [Rhizobium calliandrae]MDL2408089.1 hypothetical protein [Rhizobium calliandrae]
METHQMMSGEFRTKGIADSKKAGKLQSAVKLDPFLFVAAFLSPKVDSELHQPTPAFQEEDPAVLHWQEWMTAYEHFSLLCERQQRLETKLYSTVGPNAMSSAAWQTTDQVVEYQEAKRTEEYAADIEDRLAADLWSTRALSVAGVTAKLFAILKKGEPSNENEEFPWPEIRSVLADLIRVGGRTDLKD